MFSSQDVTEVLVKLCLRLSAQGCNIIACLRQKNEEFDICEEIIQRNGTMITKYYFDMMDEDSIKSTITQIFKSKQRIDIMINKCRCGNERLITNDNDETVARSFSGLIFLPMCNSYRVFLK